MQALAEFIMRGRVQAYFVAFAGNLVPVVSPATIGLVTLRKGSIEGLFVSLWAVLPLLATYIAGGVTPLWALLTLVSIAALMMMVISASMLRITISWQLTLYAVVFASALFSGLIAAFFPAHVEQSVPELIAFFEQMAGDQEVQFVPGKSFLLGMMAWLVAWSTVIGLLVSRWWQSLLYNPGGFKEEFRQLRLEKAFALFSMVAVVLGLFIPGEISLWTGLAGLPLMIAGIAFAHHSVAALQLGGHWLGLMYFGVLFIAPVSTVLIGLGFADSFLDLRSRLAKRKQRDS